MLTSFSENLREERAIYAYRRYTPQNWLFLGTYEELRQVILSSHSWCFVARLGPKGFQTPMWDFNIGLLVITRQVPSAVQSFAGLDVAGLQTPSEKARGLYENEPTSANQLKQLNNPDSRITFQSGEGLPLLSQFATDHQGLSTGDNHRFRRVFWEVPTLGSLWEAEQSSVEKHIHYSGRSGIVMWSTLAEFSTFCRPYRGNEAWGRLGVAVAQMGKLGATLFGGQKFDTNAAVLVPRNGSVLPALWAFCSSPEFHTEVRQVDQKLNVTNATLVKVPFDLAHWQKVAAEKYPLGLPKPFSSDATQWLFNGHPAGADQPLHVAVARLLGYQWPLQTGSELPDCPALDPDGLDGYADTDGIVCLPPINKEQPAGARLRNLLAAAIGADWSPSLERDLLAATGAKQTNLEDWLRDAFFEQHCKLFKNRPFIWDIWDGRKDGFHALVNYHRLDNAALQKLTYSYLGDWIRQQDADAKADKPGAAERLGAAQALEAELIRILEGEPPYDIFIRWKPIQEQPLGWQPDLNDGVRLNIRPFLQARDVGKKGAGILRAKPNIKWDKDRGKEPHRDKADFPWFWHATEPPQSCPGGPDFTGNRWNLVHLTLARKRAARQGQGGS